MDNNLFAKHVKHLSQHNEDKQKIIEYIKEKTGTSLSYEEIVLEKKTVTFIVSSVKKTALTKKNISALLQEIGFSVRM